MWRCPAVQWAVLPTPGNASQTRMTIVWQCCLTLAPDPNKRTEEFHNSTQKSRTVAHIQPQPVQQQGHTQHRHNRPQSRARWLIAQKRAEQVRSHHHRGTRPIEQPPICELAMPRWATSEQQKPRNDKAYQSQKTDPPTCVGAASKSNRQSAPQWRRSRQ